MVDAFSYAGADYLMAKNLIELDDSHGRAEPVHRSEKKFVVREQLAFERFGMNRASYYFMLR